MRNQNGQRDKLIVASAEDLLTIEEALNYVWRPELDFIFKSREAIREVLVLAFDSITLYVWRREGNAYRRYSSPLTCAAADFSHDWWACGPVVKGLETSLPSTWLNTGRTVSFISGALMTPFIEGQKTRERPLNPYTTRESYLATIVHEFGHAYFNKCTEIYYDSKYTNELIEAALTAYSGKPILSKLVFPPFNRRFWSEIFAFCTDRAASNIFWPAHKADVDRANVAMLNKVSLDDRDSNRYWDVPPLEKPHMSAAIVGPVLIEILGDKWPQYILDLGYEKRMASAF